MELTLEELEALEPGSYTLLDLRSEQETAHGSPFPAPFRPTHRPAEGLRQSRPHRAVLHTRQAQP